MTQTRSGVYRSLASGERTIDGRWFRHTAALAEVVNIAEQSTRRFCAKSQGGRLLIKELPALLFFSGFGSVSCSGAVWDVSVKLGL